MKTVYLCDNHNGTWSIETHDEEELACVKDVVEAVKLCNKNNWNPIIED